MIIWDIRKHHGKMMRSLHKLFSTNPPSTLFLFFFEVRDQQRKCCSNHHSRPPPKKKTHTALVLMLIDQITILKQVSTTFIGFMSSMTLAAFQQLLIGARIQPATSNMIDGHHTCHIVSRILPGAHIINKNTVLGIF